MKIIVAYSGGKDSQASLIWAVKEFGNKVEAVFCDTGWENPITYQHIQDTVKNLGIKLHTIKSKKYDGMVGLATKKGSFPSSTRRFCTEELKSKPMIDFILKQKDDILIIQGIRADESRSRSRMQKQCTFFKYYFEPYNDKGKTHSYRKKDIKAWKKQYSDDILRPVFDWTAKQVMDFIIDNGQKPNKLYYEGFKRVGCFPCIMSGIGELTSMLKKYPERFDEITDLENKIGSTYYSPDKIPDHAKRGEFTTMADLKKYIQNKNATMDMFEDEGVSCMSFYSLCE